MIAFLDTSALAQHYLPARSSAAIRRLLRSRKQLAVSSLAFAEVCAAIARAHREGRISLEHRDAAIAAAPGDFAAMSIVEPRWRLTLRVAELVKVHPLRGYDAMQLACCLEVKRAGATELWAGDGELLAAARAEGLKVVAV